MIMPIQKFEDWPEIVNYEKECVDHAKKMMKALEVLNRYRAKKIEPEESLEIIKALKQTQEWYLVAVQALMQTDGQEKKINKLWKGLEKFFPTSISGDRNNFLEMKKIVVSLAEVYKAMLEIDDQAQLQTVDVSDEVIGFDLKKEYKKIFLKSRPVIANADNSQKEPKELRPFIGNLGNLVIEVDGKIDAETPKIYLPQSEVMVNVIDANLDLCRYSFSNLDDFPGTKFCVRVEEAAIDTKDHLNSAVYKEIISQVQDLIAK
jgi:hypothetical protein